MTMEIYNVQTLGDTRRPWKLPNSVKYGVNPKLPWKFPMAILASATNNHGNVFGIPEMAVEIYKVIFCFTNGV